MLNYSHEVFFEVARNLSFSRAAEVLFISQPAISKHIKLLEESYNSNLFERKGNSIILTEEGKILFSHLAKAKEIQKQSEFDISTYKKQSDAKGSLVIGASTTVALYVIPAVLSAFHQKYPSINLRLINRNSENILKALLDHEIDLGIIEGKNKITSVKYQFFLTDDVVAVCSAKSPLARKKKISIDELKQIPVAIREHGSGTLAALTEALNRHKIKVSDFNTKIVLGGTEALKNFLLDDNCLGFLPLRSVKKELKYGELVKLNIPGLVINREFYFIQRQGSETDKLNALFIKMAVAQYNKKL